MSVFELHGRKALVTGKATANALAQSGATARYVPLNVTDEASWEAAITRTIAELDGLDIMVNNAGIEISELVIDLNPQNVLKMLEVNILGTALGIKHAFRAMRPEGAAGKGGAVINVSSVAATIAFPGIAGYSATKSAVDRLTRVAAMESGKLGEVSDMADAVVFLASDAARFITGVGLPVDGGMGM